MQRYNFFTKKTKKDSIFAEILKTMKKTLLIALILVVAGINANAQNKTSKVIHLTYKEFLNKVWDFEKDPSTFNYKGSVPAIVDFYADWCGPCRKIAPVMEKLAEEYDGRLVVYKINVDQEKDLATAFGVSSIPMVLFIPMEGQPMMQVGALSEADYRKIVVDQLLK